MTEELDKIIDEVLEGDKQSIHEKIKDTMVLYDRALEEIIKLEKELNKKDKKIEELENQLLDIIEKFNIYDWVNSNEEQLKNQIADLYKSIHKGNESNLAI